MLKKLQFGINLNPRFPVGQPDDPGALKGLKWVRLVFQAASFKQSLEDAFRFYDPVIAAYQQHGVGTLLVLNQETFWGNGPWHPDDTNRDPDPWGTYARDFGAACGQIAAHYRGQTIAYEIWNEGDIEGFSSVFVLAKHYAKILKAAADAINAQDAGAIVVLGGLASGPAEAVRYVKDVRQALGGDLPVDAVGVHPYGKWPPNFSKAPGWGGWFGPLDDTLKAYVGGFGGKPAWITEIGISQETIYPPEQWPLVLDYMQGVFDLVQKKYSKEIPAVLWFAWSDGMRNAGIVDFGGAIKAPIYNRFFEIARTEVPVPPKGALTPTTAINIRSGPGANNARIAGAMPGDWLEPLEDTQAVRAKLGQQGQWIKLRLPDGKEGFAAAWLLKSAFDDDDEQPATPLPVTAAAPVGAAAQSPAAEPAAVVPPTPGTPVEPPAPAPAPPGTAGITSAAPTTVPAAAPATPALTPITGLNVRSGPGTQHAVIGGAVNGDRLTPLDDPATVQAKLGVQGEWLRVRLPDGRDGWVAAWLVRMMVMGDEPNLGKVTEVNETVALTPTTASLNVRHGPGRHFAPIGAFAPGNRLSALEKADTVTNKLKSGENWVYVRAPGGDEGWTAGWLTRPLQPGEAVEPAPAPKGPVSRPEDVPTDETLGRQRALDFDHEPCFVRLPVLDGEAISSFSGFGPNNFSYRTWRMNPASGGLYANLGGLHSGLDFGIPLRTILCSMDWGYVVYVGPSKPNGYGAGPHNVIVRYGRAVALFGHMTSEGLKVKKGDIVKPGDPLGLSWTFNSYDHLHFEMRRFDPAYVGKLRTKAQSEGAADVTARMNQSFNHWGWTPLPDHWINPAPYFNAPLETYWKSLGWKHAAKEDADADNNGYPDRVILPGGSVPTALDLYSLASMPPTAKPHFWAGSRLA